MNNSAVLWRIEDNVKYQLYWWGFWTGKRKEKTFTTLFRTVRRAAMVLDPLALQQEPPHPALQDFLRVAEPPRAEA